MFVGLTALQAQNTCTDQLKLAQRKFDDGLLDDIPQLLANCMKDGFTDEEKTNAYKLLIQTYLFSEKQDKADEVMMQFLKDFPSYVIAVNDPKEFVNLHSTYRTKPIFKIEFKLGTTFCMPKIVEQYGTSDLNSVKPTYKAKAGFNVELNYLNKLYKNFDYSIGASLTISTFDYKNNPTSYSTVSGTFTSWYVGLPIACRYNYKYKGINFFAKIGIEPVYLLKSSASFTRKDNIITRQEPFTGTEDLLNMQKKIDIRPLIAIGTSFKLQEWWLNVAAGFKFSTIVQADKNKRYSNETLASKYFYVQDDLLFNQTYLSVSFIRPIYKPKKIK